MTDSSEESPLSFPCDFPIKAMGYAADELRTTVIEIVRRHAPDLSEDVVRSRPSSNGKFVSITVSVHATSRAQLDAIYQDLTDCPQVLMAL